MECSGLLENRASFNVELVANLSDDFFKDIFEGDNAKHRLIGIDDNRKMRRDERKSSIIVGRGVI